VEQTASSQQFGWPALINWAEERLSYEFLSGAHRQRIAKKSGAQEAPDGVLFRGLPPSQVVEQLRLDMVRRLAEIDVEALDFIDRIHDSLALAIEELVSQLRMPLDVLSEWAKEVNEEESEDRSSYFEYLDQQIDWHFRTIEARPFSECLRNWTEGYSANRMKSWREYLSQAAVLYLKTWKDGRAPTRMTWPTLRRRFESTYEALARPGGLFSDGAAVLPKPRAGVRPASELPPVFEVAYWGCDSPLPIHGDGNKTLLIKPNTPEEYEGRTLPRTATKFDRFFCPMWQDCGGVLVPQQSSPSRSESQSD
jgi:hypothetical protein